jgi:hypothetical protein
VYTTRAFLNDDARWLLGFCTEEIVSADAGAAAKLVWKRWQHDTATMAVLSEACWDDRQSTWLTFAYKYDRFSNRCATTDPSGAVESVQYDASGTFAVKRISPPTGDGVTLSETFDYEPAFGALVRQTDANAVVRMQRIDGFGRVIETSGPHPAEPSKTVVLTRHTFASDAFGAFVQDDARVEWDAEVWAWECTYADGMQRAIRTARLASDGAGTVLVDRAYDSRNQVVSEPQRPPTTSEDAGRSSRRQTGRVNSF